MGGYETKNAQSPASVLKKIADSLDSAVDYLINDNTEDKANATLRLTNPVRTASLVDKCLQRLFSKSTEASERYI
jgi:hypothetical protein